MRGLHEGVRQAVGLAREKLQDREKSWGPACQPGCRVSEDGLGRVRQGGRGLAPARVAMLGGAWKTRWHEEREALGRELGHVPKQMAVPNSKI